MATYSCTSVSRERRKAYVFRGAKIDKVRECHVNVYDYNTREWSREPFGPGSVDPKVTSNGGSVACVINDRLYMFGGWEKGHLNNHVYELNLETYVWVLLKAVSDRNQPLRKYKCGVVPYGEDMLCVFGGYGYPAGFVIQDGARYDWEDRSVGWTNELHLFHLKDRVWLVPTVTGTPPNPCAAFTFHYIDSHRVLLFGGRQKAERVNEIHILDLANWHWSGPIMPSDPNQLWPPKRSIHTSICLFDPLDITTNHQQKIPDGFPWLPYPTPDFTRTNGEMAAPTSNGQKVFVLWGMDNNGDRVDDAWILDVNTMTWSEVVLPEIVPRLLHVTQCVYGRHSECLAITCGGATTDADENDKRFEDTLLFKFGVSSLFTLCEEAIIRMWCDVSLLQPLLPPHIYTDLYNKRNIFNTPTILYNL